MEKLPFLERNFSANSLVHQCLHLTLPYSQHEGQTLTVSFVALERACVTWFITNCINFYSVTWWTIIFRSIKITRNQKKKTKQNPISYEHQCNTSGNVNVNVQSQVNLYYFGIQNYMCNTISTNNPIWMESQYFK